MSTEIPIIGKIIFDFPTITILILSILALAGGIAVVFVRDVLTAVILSGIVSLIASILFLILGAPDVAMTEATIGSALTTVVFLYTLKRVKNKKELNDD